MPATHQDIGLEEIEFWTEVCEEEAELMLKSEENKGRMVEVSQRLVPALLHALPRQAEEHVSNDTLDSAAAAAMCLKQCAQAIRDDVIELVMPFVMENIQQDSWRLREAACMSFGCILDGGVTTGAAAPLVHRMLPIVLQKLQDPSAAVRDTAAWSLGVIVPLPCTDFTYKVHGAGRASGGAPAAGRDPQPADRPADQLTQGRTTRGVPAPRS